MVKELDARIWGVGLFNEGKRLWDAEGRGTMNSVIGKYESMIVRTALEKFMGRRKSFL